VNFSPGQYRDLTKPLVEVDPDAPRRVRFGQRVLNGFLMTFLLVCVGVNGLLFLG